MKLAAFIHHGANRKDVRAAFPGHRRYLRSLLDGGQLLAAGPLANDAGALWIVEAETPEAAETMIRADPSYAAGAFLKWEIYPLAYWSAEAAKGA